MTSRGWMVYTAPSAVTRVMRFETWPSLMEGDGSVPAGPARSLTVSLTVPRSASGQIDKVSGSYSPAKALPCRT